MLMMLYGVLLYRVLTIPWARKFSEDTQRIEKAPEDPVIGHEAFTRRDMIGYLTGALWPWVV